MKIEYVALGCTERIVSASAIDGEITQFITETGERNPTDEEILVGAKIYVGNQIKKVGSKKIANVYAFIDLNEKAAVSLYNFARDLYMSSIPAAREALTGNLLELKNIYDAASAGIADVNAMTTIEEIEAYDALNTPSWP